MTVQPQLFETPPCIRCGGRGHVVRMLHDGFVRAVVTCPVCKGTGVRPTPEPEKREP